MKKVSLCLLALCLLGCNPPPAQKQDQPAQKSQAQDIIETMTQKNKTDAARRTAERVRQISADRNADLREAGGE
jgi:surfactin synthase thioesterase subunit